MNITNMPYGICVATSREDAEKLYNFMREQMGGNSDCGYEVKPPEPEQPKRHNGVYMVMNDDTGEIVGHYWDYNDAVLAMEECQYDHPCFDYLVEHYLIQ